MDFEQWKSGLSYELAAVFKMTAVEAEDYIRKTGDGCWREMFEDDLTPKEAAAEEAFAAFTSQ